MLLHSFQVSTWNSGRKRTIIICIYDSPASMRKAGRRYGKKLGLTEGYDRAYGLTQTFTGLRIYESGYTRRTPRSGYIRLIKGHLGSGIISHECTHAAVSIYRADVAKTIPDNEHEEKLCYLVGDLMTKIVNKLYALGYYN